MEWTIKQVAKLAGTTSRTLRYYDELGLVPPSRTGDNGYRYYDERSLLRLQRVLLLRELGVGLSQIADLVIRDVDEVTFLESHLAALTRERERMGKRIEAVRHTIRTLKGEAELMAEKMFEGFDHTTYQEEVESRWGREAYAKSDSWWRSMSEEQQGDWKRGSEELGLAWLAAAASGVDAGSGEAQAVARRHVEWLKGIPGTPAADPNGDLAGYVRGLAEMYVADERFAANYGGTEGATFVRDALLAYVARGAI